MKHNPPPGLVKRGGIWHIDKRVMGTRICESTGERTLIRAEQYLARRIEEVRQAKIYGVRPQRSFQEAAQRYLRENTHKKSIKDDERRLRDVMPFIGDLPINRIFKESLEPYISACKRRGNKPGTINHGIAVVRQVLNQAEEWRDEHGLTWLERAPKLKNLPNKSKKPPYPLTWEEQGRLFAQLPAHIHQLALFAVNTGCRDGEVCSLRWQWEVKIPMLGTSIFIIPAEFTKNDEDRLVVLNDVAKEVIEQARGQHPEYVFTYRSSPILRMFNSAWLRARRAAELPVRVHDLRHTFATRLRNRGVALEDRRELMGHRSASITTHYSAAELRKLIELVNRITEPDEEVMVILRRRSKGC